MAPWGQKRRQYTVCPKCQVKWLYNDKLEHHDYTCICGGSYPRLAKGQGAQAKTTASGDGSTVAIVQFLLSKLGMENIRSEVVEKFPGVLPDESKEKQLDHSQLFANAAQKVARLRGNTVKQAQKVLNATVTLRAAEKKLVDIKVELLQAEKELLNVQSKVAQADENSSACAKAAQVELDAFLSDDAVLCGMDKADPLEAQAVKSMSDKLKNDIAEQRRAAREAGQKLLEQAQEVKKRRKALRVTILKREGDTATDEPAPRRQYAEGSATKAAADAEMEVDETKPQAAASSSTDVAAEGEAMGKESEADLLKGIEAKAQADALKALQGGQEASSPH